MVGSEYLRTSLRISSTRLSCAQVSHLVKTTLLPPQCLKLTAALFLILSGVNWPITVLIFRR